MKDKKDIIVFDLETNLIPAGKSREEKRKAIRKLKVSVVCAYSYQQKAYSFFTEENINDLFASFKQASKIIGFNIIGFDYEVLKKYGLPKNIINRTIDLFALIRNETGNWYSLDKLSQENLGRGKLYKGKDLASMSGVNLYNGCKADVRNTKELFELWEKKQLKYDKQKWTRELYVYDEVYDEEDEGFPIDCCPYCGAPRNALEKFNELQDGMGIDAMSEGMLAEYIAGTWGTIRCLKCGRWTDYEI